MRYLFTILILACLPAYIVAQPGIKTEQKKKDSLRTRIGLAKQDTSRVRALYELSLLLKRSELDARIMQWASESLSYSQEHNDQWGIGASYYVRGYCVFADRNYEQALSDLYQAEQIWRSAGDKKNTGMCMILRANIHYDKGDYPGSIDNCKKALEVWESIGYKEMAGICSNDLAISYARIGNYSKAIEYAYKGLEISESLNDRSTRAQSLHLVGSYYYRFGDYENAMKNFQEATVIYLAISNRFDFARNNNMVGEVLLDQGRNAEAYQRFYESLKIYEEPGAPSWGLPWGYSNLGSVSEGKGDSAKAAGAKDFAADQYRQALHNYTISLKKFEAIQDPAGTAEQVIFIGKTYFKLGEIPVAKKYLLDGLSLSGKFGEKQNLTLCYLYLSQIDSAEGNVSEAYRHYKLYVQYRDSMFNRESAQKLSIYKVQYEFEKKEQELKLLTAENKLQSALADKQIQRKRFAWIFAGLIFVISVFTFYRYRRHMKIKAEQKLLEERLTISQDLHDNIGSILSSISVYSQVARIHSEKKEKEDLDDLLEKISATSNETVAEMNDIVWAINPRNDSVEKIIQRMESFTRPLAAARGIHFDLRTDLSIETLHLDMVKRKNFYLIFKEAVTNAIKYSAASSLQAHLHLHNNNLVLFVRDNGVGFNQLVEMNGHSTTLAGNGLRNMQARAKAINAVFSIKSAMNSGTMIELSMPLS